MPAGRSGKLAGIAEREAGGQAAGRPGDVRQVLAARADLLAKAGLIGKKRLRSLTRLTDLARAMNLDPAEVTPDIVVAMKARVHTTKEMEAVSRGVRVLDDLRQFPTMLSLLPPEPIGAIEMKSRLKPEAPSHLLDETDAWVRAATTVLPVGVETPEAHAMMTMHHSVGSKGVYAAALRSYVHHLGQSRELTGVNGLVSLFDRAAIETVIVRWIDDHKQARPWALSPRSIYRYSVTVRLTLERHGLQDEADVIRDLCKKLPVLIEGKAANEFMSVETENWCRELLSGPDRTRIFEMQHTLYASIANEALEAAKVEGFDLVELSDPMKMKKLPARKRSRAKALLRRARMFGVCAAAAAIELEGAPFRKTNLLGLMRSGTRQTFFDHQHDTTPRFTIVIPNEMLKNGKSLTARGKSMTPVDILTTGPGDYGVSILKFYLKRIRPLFPGSAVSSALFPAIDRGHAHLRTKTFDTWLLECSTEIGLPMTPHNYRHGVCSIQINDDPNCIDELEILLCDRAETLKKYYAFLDRERTLRTMQAKRSERRAQYGQNKQVAGLG